MEFTDEEMAIVRAAIRRAMEDMDEWNRKARVSPERMRQPLTPPPRRYGVYRGPEFIPNTAFSGGETE